jgi:trehalose/maltose transport system substrate-binding protein
VAHPAGVDLAVLKFQAHDVPFLKLGESTEKVEGERVVVIGNPTGLTGTVSDGIISAFRENRSMIQITAPISPGSSGSPVLDDGGSVIGVATLISSEGQNLNFAIAVEKVSAALASAAAQASLPQSSATPYLQSPTPIAQPSIAKESNFYWKPAKGVVGAGATVRFAGDSDVGEGGRWTRAVAEEWAQKTGNKVEYLSRPNDASATLQLVQQYWAAKSPDIDVFMIDVIWQGIAAPHAVDMKKYYTEDEIKAFFPRIIQNNTVGSRLISIPWFVDAGLLYYRTDLLEKYGYEQPPKTWEELAEMAKKIQDGERKGGKPDFQGFVFEGKASESVTCNAIEWIYSYGGGLIVDPDKKVTINNPKAIKALETAKSWVGTIAPLGVTTYGEEEARNLWQAGNAAFMRNWPYAYALGADPRSVIAGKFDITVLPKGGADGKNAACLGGWQLMVSAYSKVPDAAADLVRYLTSGEMQKKHAIDISLLPVRPDLYADAEVLAANPFFKSVVEPLTNAVARPSTVTGWRYNQVSTAFFQNVNKVLSGGSSAQEAVSRVEAVAKQTVR